MFATVPRAQDVGQVMATQQAFNWSCLLEQAPLSILHNPTVRLRKPHSMHMVPAEVEAAVQLAKRVLRKQQLPPEKVREQVLKIRARQDEESGHTPPGNP